MLDEFLGLKDAVAETVAALPFPKDLFTGIDEARSAYDSSTLAAIEPLIAAVEKQDWPTVLRLGLSMRDGLSFDTLMEEVARIIDSRLSRLKESYARWWASGSRTLQSRLTDFQRALFRAQTRLALHKAAASRP